MSDYNKPAQDAFIPQRGPITVQIYEIERDKQASRGAQRGKTELRELSRPTLPIRYVDRATLERM